MAIREFKRDYGRLAVLLLGDAPFYPFEATSSARRRHDRRPIGEGRYELRLHVDRTTHLPVMLAWSERFTGEHQLYVSDFRKVGGLLWPRHMTEYAEGQVVRDLKVRKYKINPRLGTSRFDPVR